MKNLEKYDFLIIGAGLFGSVFAYEMANKGKKCIVVDKRNYIAGNCFTENINGIDVHKYGPHIFHTNNKEIWDYVNQFGEFNNFINQPITIVNNTSYNLPFNMNLFAKMFDIITPNEAKEFIKKEAYPYRKLKPKNLEEQALKFVGKTIYTLFIKGYTEKQWDKPCTEISPDVLKRLPVRFTYDNNYFNDVYQGIPKNGYTNLIKNMLKNVKIMLNFEYKKDNSDIKAKKIIYTGMIDEYYDYVFGELEYRSLEFINREKAMDNFQGNAVVNYPNKNIPFTRCIEHKHFTKVKTPQTYISYEFPQKYQRGRIPYYPIGDKKNEVLYNKYKQIPNEKVIFAGRLGGYKYLNMDKVVEKALSLSKKFN